MSDLISRSALLKELNNYHYDTVNAQIRRVEHIVKAHFTELIEKQPTAFDVDKVIADLENLDVHFDNDYSSENKEPMLLRRDVFDIINKHLSGNAEHTKLE